MNGRLDEVAAYFLQSAEVQTRAAQSCAKQILVISDVISNALRNGNKVLLCGNGGSAADCQHMAAELVGRLSRDVARPALAALALTTDSSIITAYGNDYGFDGIFERQVEALGRAGDVLIAISTSGKSENLRRAVVAAKTRGLVTVALTGQGGPLAEEVHHPLVIPDSRTQHIQEALLPVEHLICLLTERRLSRSVET